MYLTPISSKAIYSADRTNIQTEILKQNKPQSKIHQRREDNPLIFIYNMKSYVNSD